MTPYLVRCTAVTVTFFSVIGVAGCSSEESSRASNGSDHGATAPIAPGQNAVNTPSVLPNGETVQPTIDLTEKQLDDMSAEMFGELSVEQRLNYMGPKIDEWKDGAWELMETMLTPEQRGVVNNEFPPNKFEYTNQQNQITAEIAM